MRGGDLWPPLGRICVPMTPWPHDTPGRGGPPPLCAVNKFWAPGPCGAPPDLTRPDRAWPDPSQPDWASVGGQSWRSSESSFGDIGVGPPWTRRFISSFYWAVVWSLLQWSINTVNIVFIIIVTITFDIIIPIDTMFPAGTWLLILIRTWQVHLFVTGKVKGKGKQFL